MTEQFTESYEQVIYSVSDLNQFVKRWLEDGFPLVWVEGEISNFTQASSGHIYFTLKDKNAQIRCVFFRTQQLGSQLNQLENGVHVTLRANPTLYTARGDFQLIVEKLSLSGAGALQRAFELLKEKLAHEGLFDTRYKKSLPKIPQQIGVITSPIGAAIHDVLSVLKKRFPTIPVIIYPSQVQGEAAPKQLIEAIQMANLRAECDVLLLTRGGGSVEDLACFNDEQLARAIFKSDIPIVSAVGHEIDFTIADFVADERAPTPSAAVSLIVPDKQAYLHTLEQYFKQLQLKMTHRLYEKKHALLQLEKQLRHPSSRLYEQIQRFEELYQALRTAFLKYIQKKQTDYVQLTTQFKTLSSQLRFHNYYQQVHFYQEKMQRLMLNQLKFNQQKLANLVELLDTLGPLKTLARGYAIVQNNQKEIIRNVDQLKAGDKILVQLNQGSALCQFLQKKSDS